MEIKTIRGRRQRYRDTTAVLAVEKSWHKKPSAGPNLLYSRTCSSSTTRRVRAIIIIIINNCHKMLLRLTLCITCTILRSLFFSKQDSSPSLPTNKNSNTI